MRLLLLRIIFYTRSIITGVAVRDDLACNDKDWLVISKGNPTDLFRPGVVLSLGSVSSTNSVEE